MARRTRWNILPVSRTQLFCIGTRTGLNAVSLSPPSLELPNSGSISCLRDNEPLKEYLQRFNIVALEVPSATQEVKANAFSQGLLDGDFFKSLAKKPLSKFDALLARAAKYINMEDAQAAKKESRGEKRKEVKEKIPSKKPQNEFREKKAPYQRINTVYTPLTVPITQALMAVEGKGLLARPRSWKEGP
ncbi:UNVERIFIED_CONTAM: hypothetical protein Slati_3673800 [Sesamum latifolium]|uniref:Retrotransposon gag domain-containing protein n=1 Tax=Sesamum latifolium TaxID=2727402 RepID=A0AAW2U0Q3_9LAMI